MYTGARSGCAGPQGRGLFDSEDTRLRLSRRIMGQRFVEGKDAVAATERADKRGAAEEGDNPDGDYYFKPNVVGEGGEGRPDPLLIRRPQTLAFLGSKTRGRGGERGRGRGGYVLIF